MAEPNAPLDFLALGELLVDFCQTGLGPEGHPQYQALPGGAPANVAVAMAKWGRRAGFLGCVGQDALGQGLARTLEGAGVDCRHLLTTHRPTSLALVSLAQDGERSFAFYWKDTACSHLPAALADPAHCTGSRIFHFGSVSLTTAASRTTTLAAVRAARSGGAVISFDANLRPALWGSRLGSARTDIRQAMALAHVVKLSGGELAFLAAPRTRHSNVDRDDPRVAPWMAQVRQETGAELLFVTFGAQGACWLGAQSSGSLGSPRVQVLDTTGAGDCFVAGVLHSFLAQGRALRDLRPNHCEAMVRMGVTAGALATRGRGGIPSIPNLSEIQFN